VAVDLGKLLLARRYAAVAFCQELSFENAACAPRLPMGRQAEF
jgi:hypothetical protein